MDMKGSIAAIKDAITKSTAERTSPEVISAAYAVVYLIGGVLLASARLLGAAGPFGMAAVAVSGAGLNGVAALIGAAIGYIISCGLAGSIRYLAAIVLVYTISFAFQDTKLASKACSRLQRRPFPRCQPAYCRALPRCSPVRRQRRSCLSKPCFRSAAAGSSVRR